MFGLPALYFRVAGYAVAALLIGGVGYKVGAKHWETKYSALQAENWQGRAQREEVTRKALEGQLAQARAVSANNESVLHDLQTQTAVIVADRDRTADLVHRLLERAARTARRPDVPAPKSEPGAPGAPEPESPDRIAGLLTDAALECRDNAARYQALIDQIRPQL